MSIDMVRCPADRRRPLWRIALFALAAAQVGSVAIRAQTAPPAHATVRLVAEDGTFKTGDRTWVGVLFDLEPGWHIYWLNPGDAGDPPRIQWDVPAGFRVGEVRWPVPTRLGNATLVDYGYEGRVLLAAPLQVPADYAPGNPVALAADVRYVICREVCISARARAAVTVPASETPSADVRELFRTTRQRWPAPAPRGWQVSAIDEGARFVLSVQTGFREASARFFPLVPDQIDNAAAQVVAPATHGVELTLTKSDPLAKSITMLRGVVVLSADRGFEIAAPVSSRR